HVAGRLNDLMKVVVEDWERRRSGRRPESEQAALTQRSTLRIVVRARRSFEAGILCLLLIRGWRSREPAGISCASRGGQLRHAAVRGIDDDRRRLLSVDRKKSAARVDPEVVVSADVTGSSD